MGRTRTKNKKNVKQVEAAVPATASAKQPSTSALLEKAQTLIVQCDYDLAQKFAQRILEKEPTNAEAKEILGVAFLETGELESAKEVFTSLLTGTTSPPQSAHLYLAQLSEDDPQAALQHYQAAIEILSGQLKGKERATDEDAKSDEAELKSSIVRALISQVEIWMDPSYDLCFAPEAEKTCEDLLNLALQTDPGNSEALQALASVRMSQQRPDDAQACLEKAWIAWKDLELDDPKLPPIPTRLGLVKLFLELHLYSQALLVLHGIVAADDQEVEAWYLEGWCFFMMAEQAKENGGTFDELTWEELAKDARDCLETCQVLHTNQEHPDTPLLEHTRELIQQLDNLGIKPSPIEEDDEPGEGDWEDVDSEDGDGDVEMD